MTHPIHDGAPFPFSVKDSNLYQLRKPLDQTTKTPDREARLPAWGFFAFFGKALFGSRPREARLVPFPDPILSERPGHGLADDQRGDALSQRRMDPREGAGKGPSKTGRSSFRQNQSSPPKKEVWVFLQDQCVCMFVEGARTNTWLSFWFLLKPAKRRTSIQTPCHILKPTQVSYNENPGK